LEFDEEPPHEIDKEALKIAVQIALLLNCEILPLAQIMRKTVIDGSNTSGFQRTVLIAKNGFVESSFGRVRIQSICLEEDAARKISDDANKVTFRLDRLGIPLVEIATYPDLYYPEQVKEVALKLGEILRACKVKRGIGTIRQDVNISTPNHPRVEIKGFQDPAMMIRTIELEIERQKKEGKKGEAAVRKANPDGTTDFLRPMPGAARMYPETDLLLLHLTRDFINDTKKTLPKLKTEIAEELKTRGLNESMIKLLLDSNKLIEFEALLKVYNNPNSVAKLLLVLSKEVASHEKVKEEIFTLDILETILQAVASNKISEGDVKHILEEIAKGKSISDALKVEKAEVSDIESDIAKIVKEKPGLNANAYMGLVMAKFKGKVDGKIVMAIINKLIK
jgi:Glu-tRNA(Gln) amidotransferase subunit E-like FAD-binding protein